MTTNRKSQAAETEADADAPAAIRPRLSRRTEKVVPATETAASPAPAASKHDDVLNTFLRIAEGDGRFEHKLRRTQGIIASHGAASRAQHRGAANVDERVDADRKGLLDHLRQACDSGKLSADQLELIKAALTL